MDRFLLDSTRRNDNTSKKCNIEVFWLLDVRFDFLLPLFMKEFKLQKKDITMVNSYHSNIRNGWRRIYVSVEERAAVNLMEPDVINRSVSKSLQLDRKNMIISLTGVGLPQSDNLITMISTGLIAELCNDKWWQYNLFKKCNIKTPDTYKYTSLKKIEKNFNSLLYKYKKVIIKRPCLSGGYMMRVLTSDKELDEYQLYLQTSKLKQDFLISEYIVHQQSFASMGVISEDGEVVYINIVTEQVLYREVEYEGIIFPAFIHKYQMEKIKDITIKIGKELSKEGYRGYFNIDFILANEQLYVVEINARWGFGIILLACLYEEKFWKVIQGACKDQIKCPQQRIVIGKIKGKEGMQYSNLENFSDIVNWSKKEENFFKTFYCGTEEPELLQYGSYIGLFGERFSLETPRDMIMHKFMKSCLEFY